MPTAEPLPLHEAIARAMAGRVNQRQLAERLGYSQPSVSQWLTGSSLPKVTDIPRIEDACERPRGFILQAAGYCSPATTVSEALAHDVQLSDLSRAIVLAAYESARGGHGGAVD